MSRIIKILIVEDSPAMRQLLTLAVKKRPNVEVAEAGDGLAALKLLSASHYDLLLMDLNMPILDGMKLIKRVRESETAQPNAASSSHDQRVRIAIITTESAQATEDQARALGADFFLRKPVSRRDIDKLLSEAFGA
ncbi:MAG TPA: response regulator [Polyangia bacterium]|jgi:two-component system chemotaxis response regulator CheY|nr:response regulator [Polyangia bacterium]